MKDFVGKNVLVLGGSRGINECGGQQQIHGVDIANLVDEFHGRSPKGIDGPVHFRQPEAGMRDRCPNVGRQQQFQDTSNETRLPGHVVIDASASYPVTRHLTVFLLANNIGAPGVFCAAVVATRADIAGTA